MMAIEQSTRLTFEKKTIVQFLLQVVMSYVASLNDIVHLWKPAHDSCSK